MKPNLEHYDQFKSLLSGYQINDEGKELLEQTKLVLMTSPTSVGRNSIINELVKTGEYEFIISDTTRPKRENNGVMEEDGVQYWFKSEEEILEDLKAGRFLEADIIHNQQVSGISMRELEKATKDNKIAIDELYYIGADKVKKVKPDTFVIFVLPPSYEEWMRRLLGRGEMTTDEVKNRLKSAELELESTAERDYYRYVINDDLQEATQTVRRIVEKGEYSEEEHQKGKDLAWKLLSEVKKQLYS